MMRIGFACVALVAVTGLCGGVSAQTTELSFGVYTSDKPTTMFKKFAPFLRWMEKGMSVKTGKHVSLKLKIYKTYGAALTALVEDKVDFVRFGAASYVLARHRNPHVHLLAVENKKGKKSFKGMIVVRANSPLKKVSDLAGKTFAFGDSNSTIGRYLAQNFLLEAGVGAEQLTKFEFLGRHDKVFRSVQVGDFEAGALKSGTFKKLNKKKSLRVLFAFDAPTKPWVARSKLDAKLRATMTEVLLETKDKKVLKSLKVNGFFKTSFADFADLSKKMRTAGHFEAPAAKPHK